MGLGEDRVCYEDVVILYFYMIWKGKIKVYFFLNLVKWFCVLVVRLVGFMKFVSFGYFCYGSVFCLVIVFLVFYFEIKILFSWEKRLRSLIIDVRG